jgi:hypothetical protein
MLTRRLDGGVVLITSSRRVQAAGIAPATLADELKSTIPSASIPVYKVSNDKRGKDQSNRTNSPAHTHAPIETTAAAKEH